MHCDFVLLDCFTSFNIKKIKLKNILMTLGLVHKLVMRGAEDCKTLRC